MEPQIKQHNLREQALDILKARLVSGELAPGEIYSAAALATELGVSNSPVREAMLTLVNQGVMETVRNRGFRVVPIQRKQLEDIFNVRMLLELPSVKALASEPGKVRAIETELRQKLVDLKEYAARNDLVGYMRADKEFHLMLLGALGNPYLVSTVESLRDQVRQHGVRDASARTILSRSSGEHELILDAILSGNGDQAAENMRSHVSQLIEDFSGPESV